MYGRSHFPGPGKYKKVTERHGYHFYPLYADTLPLNNSTKSHSQHFSEKERLLVLKLFSTQKSRKELALKLFVRSLHNCLQQGISSVSWTLKVQQLSTKVHVSCLHNHPGVDLGISMWGVAMIAREN